MIEPEGKDDRTPEDAAEAMRRIAEGAAKGGRSRAESLSDGAKKAIAKKGAAARWHKSMPRATHAGVLNLAGTKFDCAVLDDDSRTRVLTEGTFMDGMGMYWSGAIAERRRADAAIDPTAAQVPLFMAFENLKPFIDNELRALLASPIKFLTSTGQVGHGIKAEIIPKICNVWLRARDAGVLGRRQEQIATRADLLVRGLAEVAIVSLVDEATGFQHDRARAALQEILEAFVAVELRGWVKTFPTEFYRQMFRLKNWRFIEGSNARSPIVGRITNNIVYQRLAPGVLDRLRQKNPPNAAGNRPHRHFQWLTEDIGDPKLREHLASVTDLMKVSDSWDQFLKMLDRARPKCEKMPLFPDEGEGDAVAV